MSEPAEILARVSNVLSILDIAYMIVGATAMRAYVPGRTTFDTDIVIQLDEVKLAQFYDELGDDWMFEWDVALKGVRERSMFNAIHYRTAWKLDLIPLKDTPFQITQFARRRLASVLDTPIWVQTIEDLILSKLEWGNRSGSARQLEDVRSLLRAGLPLEENYLLEWANKIGVAALLEVARSD